MELRDKLGQKHKRLLLLMYKAPITAEHSPYVQRIGRRLIEWRLMSADDQGAELTREGRDFVRNNLEYLMKETEGLELQTWLASQRAEEKPKLSKKDKLFLVFVSSVPRRVEDIRGAKKLIPVLLSRDLILLDNDALRLSQEGEKLLVGLAHKDLQVEADKLFSASYRSARRLKNNERAEEFLDMYRKGFTYQDIGDFHGISRERVRQILNQSPNFETYLAEHEEQRRLAEIDKARDRRFAKIDKSLAIQFPERVEELWDWTKNGDLNPASIPSRSAGVEIWWKCPLDGHSWKKRPADIATSWRRSRTSGCPKCAGKTRAPIPQPKLSETYPELVKAYWDHERNTKLGLDPNELTLASNRKVCFKCPIDGHTWQATITSTVIQQWSRGNSGCRVCNGTINRNVGRWRKAEILQVMFHEEVEKYWNYERNLKDDLDPTKITVGSSKRAWFRCPIDGHNWQAKIAAIRASWSKGNSGCPACRGFGTKRESL